MSLANDAVRTLNELNCGASTGRPFSAAATTAQSSSLAQILDKCRRFQDAPECGTDKECYDAVCGGVDYRGNAASFEPLDLTRLSLRPPGTEPKPLAQLLGPTGTQAIQRFLAECLLPSGDVKRRLDDSGVLTPFLDPGLRRNERKYHRVIKRMHEASMLGYQLEPPLERIGFFAVGKKDGRQRLVVDCRRSNCHFSDPPRTKLPTSSSFSRLPIDPSSTIYSACWVLKDAFYQFELPQSFTYLYLG